MKVERVADLSGLPGLPGLFRRHNDLHFETLLQPANLHEWNVGSTVDLIWSVENCTPGFSLAS